MSNRARVIALYLPQYYPVKENDEFWGKGFTEWRNVTNAKPLFKGHYQPRLPADLGFYDLRLDDIRIQQAKMASYYGIEGFCYWHYWFGNHKMILQMPMERLLETGKPDFPFCIGWANHSWSNKTWQRTGRFKKSVTFLKQTYPGEDDLKDHFYYLLPAFKDPRYIQVDGKPLVMIFNPPDIPNNEEMIKCWNKLAVQNGLKGIHFVARLDTITSDYSKDDIVNCERTEQRYNSFIKMGYDSIYAVPVDEMKRMSKSEFITDFEKLTYRFHINTTVEKYNYKKMLPYMFNKLDYEENVYPQIMPHWDNTPRAGKRGYVFTHESPANFGKCIDGALKCVEAKQPEHRIIFAHSWNEWGEGAYLEPDLKYGLSYLEELRKRIVY